MRACEERGLQLYCPTNDSDTVSLQMVILTTKLKPVEYTVKGTACRAVLNSYAPEILAADRVSPVALADVEFPDRAS